MRLRPLRSKFARAGLLAAGCGLVLALAVSCQPGGADPERLTKLESSVAQVSGLATQVRSLQGQDEGLASQVNGIHESLAGLQAGIDDLSGRVSASAGTGAELAKKIDALSGQVGSLGNRIAGVEQKISLLETRYNDHLRKYHNGG